MANEVALEKVAKPIFGITSRRYRQMASDGIVPAVVNGKIDFVPAAKALIEYYRKLSQSQGVLNLADERTALTAAKRKLAELDLEERKKDLIPRNLQIEWLRNLITEAQMAFMNIPRRLASVLAVKNDEKEIELELRREIKKILEELSKHEKIKLRS